jgi:ATP-dependent RNA helicase DDX52/ROK1
MCFLLRQKNILDGDRFDITTMDIAKLLSRTVRQNKAAPGNSVSLTKVPSTGTSANPQLYHDPIPDSRGTKRKRGAEKQEQVITQSVEEEDLNFFATKPLKSKSQQTAAEKAAPGSSKPSPDNSPDAAKILDEEECRQILRSHRLKVTLLPSGAAPAKKVKKSKKTKTSKKASGSKTKELYPQPLLSFAELRTGYGISGRLNDNLADQGYKIPTEVQMGSLPLLLRPKTTLEHESAAAADIDLLAVAPTGSGKTLAFLIPIVNGILQRRRKSNDKGVHDLEAIVVAPTKELASQIVNEAKKLCTGTGVKVIGMRKGLRIVGTETADALQNSSDEEESEEEDEDTELPKKISVQPVARSDILVTTPGLLLSSLSKPPSAESAPLPTVRTLVLDEADVLLDPLFRDQTLGIWVSCINPDLRVTLWSATMGSNIEALASATIQSRRTKLGLEDQSNIIRLIVGLKDSAIPNITHRLIYAATEPGKLIAIRQLLHPTTSSTDSVQSLRPPFLVFTQTIPRAIALHSELLYDIPAEAGGSSRIAVLHSDLSDSVRDHIMTRFRNGEIWVMVTTDILSRGVDFRGINGVVNYDVPNSGASYIHRVGRTGRAGRDGGVAVTLYTKEDIPYVKNIANIIAASEKQAGKPAGEASMQKWLLDALPNPSKEEKKKLKKYGVEARRGGLGQGREGKEAKTGKGRMQISTKSGYERRLENNRRGAIQGSKRRVLLDERVGESKEHEREDIEWGGIDE